jgi:VanZ family protein
VFKYAKTLSVIWALIILVLCSMPGQYVPSVSLLEMLSFDKWVHAVMFFVLCALIFIHVKKQTEEKKKVILFLTIAILYGCSLEIMQGTLFSNRSADWNDIIANSLGCLMAFLFYKKVFVFLSESK